MSRHGDALVQLRERGPLAAGQVRFLVNAVAPDVDARVATGAAHGRINPTALHLEDDGTVRLTDAANPVEADAHAAPEVLAGSAPTARSEVFSLASTTYTLLTGHPPNPYGFATVRRARPDLGPQVDGVLAQATARGPEFRYPSATAYAGALATALGGPDQPILPTPEPVQTPPPPVPLLAPVQQGVGRAGRRIGIPDGVLPFVFLLLVALLIVGFVVVFL